MVGVGALTMFWRSVIAPGIPAPFSPGSWTRYGTGEPANGANSHPNTSR